MSAQTRIKDGFERLATIVKNLSVKQGDLSQLTTTEKNSLIGAINEIKQSMGNVINDGVASGTSTYSSQKIDAQIASAIATALEGEDLSDIADRITALIQADKGLVSATATQAFNTNQQSQARTNIGAASATELATTKQTAENAQTGLATLSSNIGNTDYNYVTDIDNIWNS